MIVISTEAKAHLHSSSLFVLHALRRRVIDQRGSLDFRESRNLRSRGRSDSKRILGLCLRLLW